MSQHRRISSRSRPRVLAALGSLCLTGIATEVVSAQAAETPPNVVVIVTDDMRESDFAVLEQTCALLASNGTTFPNFIVTTPMCGPSRASILTGRYAHNHGVFENGPPPGGWPGFRERGLEEQTVATALHDAGYHTVLAGKYVNGLPDEGNVPPGWDEFYGVGQIAYTDFVLNENGEPVAYPAESGAYSTDVLVNKLLDTIEREPAETPLFLYFAPMAPHTPARAAPRHDKTFRDAELETGPAYSEVEIADKPDYIRQWPEFSAEKLTDLTRLERKRLTSLLAVDEAVAALWQALERHGRLANTYIFFCSDNGYLMGEHRATAKQVPYEEAIRIPMLAYGPRFAAGATDDRLVANIDIAPTAADIAGAALPGADGVSILGEGSREAILIEHEFVAGEGEDEDGEVGGDGRDKRWPPTYRAVRTRDYLYVEYDTGERELYDLRSDPDQLVNLLANWEGQTRSAEAEALAESLRPLLISLHECAGATC